jgi:glutamine amidotransferase
VIAIVDYGMGNLRSVERALASLSAPASITSDHDELRAAERVVLPGVGAFGQAMGRLRSDGLDVLLTELVRDEGKPFLGICLGMQLICRESQEHGHNEGLGWIEASVVSLKPGANGLRVPHIGWNETKGDPESTLLPGEGVFYYVHSFHAECDERSDVAGTCRYGIDFTAVIERENILATQFHPEKSQVDGLELLKRFLAWQPTAAPAA